MSKFFSSFLNLHPILFILILLKEKTTVFDGKVSEGLFFCSSLTGWEWHRGQIEITFLDTLWVMAASVTILAMLVFAARNARRKHLLVKISAITLLLTSANFGMILCGNFLNIFVQLISWSIPTLARLLIR